ncbi:MAG: (Fe-S)-binding protein [Nanoarchaeota archaeon]|nr:(Fe-S)-binding protein [Nanoarchaeota archaeon]
MGIIDFVRKIGEKTLYFPGAFTGIEFEEHSLNYQEILGKLGISFVILDLDLDSGLEKMNMGYRKDAKKTAMKNFILFKKNSISKIITNSPEDFYMFEEIYPTFVRGWDIKIEYICISILEALKKRKIRYLGPRETREVVSYQDSCYLARRCGIMNEPREVIGILGGRIIEIEDNREDVLCCGAGGGVYKNNPNLARGAALNRSKGIPEEASKFICSSSLCYANLKSVNEKPIEFSSFVLGKLRGLGI